MNVTAIVLGILLFISIYVLYLYLSPAYTSLTTTASLMANTPPLTALDSPTSPRYAYGLWLYVNSWNNTSDYKYIFYRNNNIKLYLDKTQLNLYLDIYMQNGAWFSDPANNGTPILITNNYPIQKWCYIVISVDNNFIDCYLDGKLVLSQKTYISSSPSSSPTPSNGSSSSSETTLIYPQIPPDIGNSGTSVNGNGANLVLGGYDNGGLSAPVYVNFDAALNNFVRWSSPVNPQIVWDTYVTGNGSNLNILPKMSAYNARLDILKNNAMYTSFSLF